MATVKNHIDGGTFKVIAAKFQPNGWGVAITEWTTYKGNVIFEICRCAPDGNMMRMSTAKTEALARKAGNALWFRDRV